MLEVLRYVKLYFMKNYFNYLYAISVWRSDKNVDVHVYSLKKNHQRVEYILNFIFKCDRIFCILGVFTQLSLDNMGTILADSIF